MRNQIFKYLSDLSTWTPCEKERTVCKNLRGREETLLTNRKVANYSLHTYQPQKHMGTPTHVHVWTMAISDNHWYVKHFPRVLTDAINKIRWKCVCNLSGIKHAHMISDCTKLFVRTEAQYRYIMVYSTQAWNDAPCNKYLSYSWANFTKLSLQSYESQRSECS